MPTPFTKSFLSMSKPKLQEAAETLNLNTMGTMNTLWTCIKDHITNPDNLHTLIADDNYTYLFPSRFRCNYVVPPVPAMPQRQPSPEWGGIHLESSPMPSNQSTPTSTPMPTSTPSTPHMRRSRSRSRHPSTGSSLPHPDSGEYFIPTPQTTPPLPQLSRWHLSHHIILLPPTI